MSTDRRVPIAVQIEPRGEVLVRLDAAGERRLAGARFDNGDLQGILLDQPFETPGRGRARADASSETRA